MVFFPLWGTFFLISFLIYKARRKRVLPCVHVGRKNLERLMQFEWPPFLEASVFLGPLAQPPPNEEPSRRLRFLLLLYALCPGEACAADNSHMCAPLPLRTPLHPTDCLLSSWALGRNTGMLTPYERFESVTRRIRGRRV